MRNRKGFVIILVLAILLLLVLLAITYLTLQLTERNITRNYMDNKRAKLIAQSGVDLAIGRLNDITHAGWFTNGKFTDTSWIYNYEDSSPPTPSFAYPLGIKINSQDQKFSMLVASSTYGINSDIFSLKILDTQSQININDGANISNTHYTSRNLQRILNILGMQVTPIVPNLGDRIIPIRPAGGYADKKELIKILGQEEYSRIKDFITVNSWTNDSVAVPVPLSDYQSVADSYPFFDSITRPTDPATGQKIYRYGHNLNWKGEVISNFLDPVKSKLIFYDSLLWLNPTHHGVYSTDALNPQWIELTARSPVNINTASAEVLKALIIDLQGFFVMEKRTPNPVHDGSGYSFMRAKYTYDKDRWEQESRGAMTDELGFIYKTKPYVGTGGKNTFGTDANKIVQEIIACRKREPSPNVFGLIYPIVNFGGSFKSWAQFNVFVDTLVQKDLILDDMQGYFDTQHTSGSYLTGASDTSTIRFYVTSPPVEGTMSYAQIRQASFAAGDALKANFNPNLHLNELNPDRQLFTMVDKTDLIVNSTEFCFTPMGYFEIASEGYVLLPQGTKDSLTSADNSIIARAKIETIVKLFDACYETSQDRFYQGDWQLADRLSGINNATTTNNNRSIETGPEVDNGKAIEQTEYDGYIRLSTNLGCLSTTKSKGALLTTLTSPGPEYGESIHSHFQLDHVAHYHSGGATAAQPMGSVRIDTTTPPIERRNSSDKSERSPYLAVEKRSPYSPVDSDDPSNPRYRLCRSFRSSKDDPPGYYYSPLDLRSDGAYVEPHSAFGYDMVNFNTEATGCFWLKPNWFPELGGRARTFISMRRYMPIYENDYALEWPLPFDLMFWPRNPTSSDTNDNRLVLCALYSDKFIKVTSRSAGVFTYILNHEYETSISSVETQDRFRGTDNKFNYLRNREWSFIVARFYTTSTTVKEKGKEIVIYSAEADIIVNNDSGVKYNSQSTSSEISNDFWFRGPYIIIGGDFSSYCATNDINIVHDTGITQSYCSKIFFADSTIDEFFFWADNSNAVTYAQDIYRLGRYYKSQDSNSSDAVFTSQQLKLILKNKFLESESTVVPPAVDGWGLANTQTNNNIELLGIAWTYYAEDYLTDTEPDGTPKLGPVMRDWKNLNPDTNPIAMGSSSLCEIRLRINDVDSTIYDNDGYSAVNTSINSTDIIKYKVKFKIGAGADESTVLLASPVFDDITIYYTDGVKFMSYSCND